MTPFQRAVLFWVFIAVFVAAAAVSLGVFSEWQVRYFSPGFNRQSAVRLPGGMSEALHERR